MRLRRAHDVDAGNMRVHVVAHRQALHLGAVLRVAKHLLRRDQPGLNDALLAVDIVQEHVERVDALLQATFHLVPFRCRNDARNDVERNQTFGARAGLRVCAVTIDGKGDAVAVKRGIGLCTFLRDARRRHLGQPILIRRVMGADARRCAQTWGAHFVEDVFHRWCIPENLSTAPEAGWLSLFGPCPSGSAGRHRNTAVADESIMKAIESN